MNMKNDFIEGDRVSIHYCDHYCDIDCSCYGNSVNSDGVVIRGEMNGTVLVEYKDEVFINKIQKEFYPHDLTLIED